ncbi:MAG: ABC transporter ATP-binding protein [Firmicutes bacterium]|nr:ABC transporter ATP-binding protein [Bacillota bacterium]
MLELVEVVARYGETEVLHGISFTVPPGRITTLIGANGAGKTTILRCITGLLAVSRGKIMWKGKDLTVMPSKEIVRSGVTMVPEGRHVFPRMTVRENLEMGAYLRRDKMGIEQDFEWALSLFPALKSRLKQTAGTLSGGEQQMLAMGRALMAAPELLLLDEPSMGLSPLLVEEVFSVIERIREMGKTILLVEQNAVMSLSIADQAYVLELGAVVLSGTGESLLHNPEVEAAYLGV